MRVSIEKKVTISLAIPLLFLSVVGGITYWSVVRLNKLAAQVAHSNQLIKHSELLLSGLKDAETGQRGYLLTGRQWYLEPYTAGLQTTQQELQQLRSLVIDYLNQQQRFVVIERLIATKLSELDRTIRLRKTQGLASALRVVQTNQGKLAMNGIRKLIREMQNEEQQQLQQRQTQQQVQTQIVTGAVGIGGVLAFILVPFAMILINRDFAKRKQAEALVAESEERFRQLSEATFEAIAIVTDGKIIEANQRFTELFGYEHSEVIGKATSFFAPQGADLAAETSEGSHQLQGLRKNGVVFAIESRSRAIFYQGHEVQVTAIRDVSERQQAEQALQRANAQLTDSIGQLEVRNREIALLGALSDMLQACLTIDEAYQALAKLVQPLFPEVAGGVFTISASKHLVEGVVSWGEQTLSQPMFTPNECWALRRGRSHLVGSTQLGMSCQHIHNDSHTQTPAPPLETLCVPMMAQGDALGILFLAAQSGWFTSAREQLAVTVAEHIALALANLKLREALQQQSIRDILTGLFNRRYLEESLERELRRAERKQQSLGIILFDVDHFKRLNDTFGHDAGDTVLRELGLFIKSQVRGSDIACRYGGEEFLLLLPEASLKSTCERAEQIREGFKHLNLQNRRQSLGVITMSLGVAVFPNHGLTGEAIIQAADVALYRAKHEGRDRVVAAK